MPFLKELLQLGELGHVRAFGRIVLDDDSLRGADGDHTDTTSGWRCFAFHAS
jgi:hypothetical protein